MKDGQYIHLIRIYKQYILHTCIFDFYRLTETLQ